jgi:hypothetical protein
MPFFGSGGGSAGIGGSTGATDNAILRADGTGAATLQNSGIAIDDAVSPFACTAVASTDVITAVGHNFIANQAVRFPTLTGGGGLIVTGTYFVRDISGDTFKVSTTSGGAAFDITTDMTAGTVVAIQENVTIKNISADANSSIVISPKGTGAFIVGSKPSEGSTATLRRGDYAIDIQTSIAAGSAVASGSRSVVVGNACRAAGESAVAVGDRSVAINDFSISIGREAGGASVNDAICIGTLASASATNGVVIGRLVANSLRSAFATRVFSSVYWSGSTTNATATILNLDGTATNRLTIAANTAVIANLYIIARRTDTVDKWFSGQRKVAIRRNNANGTAIIGSVETIGADQTEGSPTWSVAITADDTNEALQVEVTGAASETVSWRVMAFYHVV